MLRRLSPTLVGALLLALASTSSLAQNTKAQLNSQVTNNFPDQSTGAITPAIIRAFFNNQIQSFQQFAGVNAQTGTSYTIQVSDYGQLVTFNNAAPVSVVIPQATGGFGTFNFFATNVGAGAVTFSPTTSTICGSSTKAIAQNASIWIVSDGTNYQCFQSSSGGGGGTPGGSNGNVQFNASGTFGGSGVLNFSSPTLTVGSAASSITGVIALAGSIGGAVSIKPQNNSGTFNFNLPITAGSTGTPLLSGSGGTNPMTWGAISGTTNTFTTLSGSLVSGNCVKSDASGNLIDAGTTCGGPAGVPAGSNTQLQFNSTGAFGASANLTWISPTLTIGVTGSTTGQIVLTGSSTGAISIQGQAAAGTFNFNLPITAGGSGLPLLSGGGSTSPMTWGTISGNTSKFATTSGALGAGNCVSIDASGNLVDAGGACTTGGGGGTVTSSTAGQIAWYAASGTTIVGNANITAAAGVVTHGQSGSVIGKLVLAGNTSGAVTISPQAAAGTFNFNLPITAGSSGTPLLSGGGSSTAMSWGSVSGNTSTFATTSGSLTNGDCASFDASGNLIASAGAVCLGLASGTSGGIPYFSSTSAIASSALLNANAIVIGGGAGTAPFTANTVTLTGSDHSSLTAVSTASSLPQFVLENATVDANSASFLFQKVRSGGGNDTQSGDALLEFQAQGFSSSAFEPTARIRCLQAAASSGVNIPSKCLIVTSNAAGQVNQTLTFDNLAHLGFSAAALPTASSCAGFALDTGASDAGGRVSFTSSTTCAISFSGSFTNPPFCTVSPGSAASTVLVTRTASVLTATFGTAQTSMTWHCTGN